MPFCLQHVLVGAHPAHTVAPGRRQRRRGRGALTARTLCQGAHRPALPYAGLPCMPEHAVQRCSNVPMQVGCSSTHLTSLSPLRPLTPCLPGRQDLVQQGRQGGEEEAAGGAASRRVQPPHGSGLAGLGAAALVRALRCRHRQDGHSGFQPDKATCPQHPPACCNGQGRLLRWLEAVLPQQYSACHDVLKWALRPVPAAAVPTAAAPHPSRAGM